MLKKLSILILLMIITLIITSCSEGNKTENPDKNIITEKDENISVGGNISPFYEFEKIPFRENTIIYGGKEISLYVELSNNSNIRVDAGILFFINGYAQDYIMDDTSRKYFHEFQLDTNERRKMKVTLDPVYVSASEEMVLHGIGIINSGYMPQNHEDYALVAYPTYMSKIVLSNSNVEERIVEDVQTELISRKQTNIEINTVGDRFDNISVSGSNVITTKPFYEISSGDNVYYNGMYRGKKYRTVFFVNNEPVKGFNGKLHLDWANTVDDFFVSYPIDENVIPEDEFFAYAITFDLEGMKHSNFGELGPERGLLPIIVERVGIKYE